MIALNLSRTTRFHVEKLDRWQLRRLTEATFECLMNEAEPTLLDGWSYHRALGAWVVRKNAPNPHNQDSYPESTRRAIFEEEWPDILQAAVSRLTPSNSAKSEAK